ncbi:MAG: 50S ribosomal protein L9 [Pleurocapsa sp. SU_196_0]|nr:50S ribosomal protein L9 [Pleurocapsa sp. SU_196_0]
MKNAKVILLEPVVNLGTTGAIVEVKAGYARNFLLPRGVAAYATPANLKNLEAQLRAKVKRLEAQKSDAEKLAGQFAELTVDIKAKAGEGKIYGTVTSQMVADAVEAQTGLSIDRRKVEMGKAIKELGEYTVVYKPHPEVPIPVKLNVTAA